jgi:UDP-glucose-4-epimerase GalE
MARTGVRRLVFSSSAAVYGAPSADVITETQPLSPVNPYGHTKLMIERMLAESARAEGLAAFSLRYFNACGAHGNLGEDHEPETHLIPRLCARLLGRLAEFAIHGEDYPTPDGTPIRDYVHVLDLATAHAAAVTRLDSAGFEPINLGTGEGASVREVLSVAEDVAGEPVHAMVGPRRAGDPPRLVASCERAADRLGWKAEASGLRRIVEDAYRWHRDHPAGYGSR